MLYFHRKRKFTMMEKIGAVNLIKLYGGEGRKYLGVPRIKYMVLKCGSSTKNWDRILI